MIPHRGQVDLWKSSGSLRQPQRAFIIAKKKSAEDKGDPK
jgi:hypothetical protein